MKGKGLYMSVNCKETEIKEGQMYILFPREWHNYYPDKQTGWDEYWIGFEGTEIDNKIRGGYFNKQKTIFDVGINNKIVQLYRQAIDIAETQNSAYQQLLGSIVNILLSYAYTLNR